jgi:hypothetical protein
MIDLHEINIKIFYLEIKVTAATNSLMFHTCKCSTALRRKSWKNYRRFVSSRSKTTKGWCYGRKPRVSIYVYSTIIKDWILAKGT